MAELQTDRRVPRGLGPEHEVPLLDQHAEAMFRYYHEPPTLAEEAHGAQRGPLTIDIEPNAFEGCTGELFSDGPPTLAEHAEMVQLDPMAGVPLRGWLRLAWAATKAGFRDAWARLRGEGRHG